MPVRTTKPLTPDQRLAYQLVVAVRKFIDPGLGFEERFAYKLSTNSLCSVDIITVLQSGGMGLMQGASCGLGSFQQIQKVGK